MRELPVQQAVGHVLCHDMTQIIPGEYKGARFRKGHVVAPEDVDVLLSMGKRSVYVPQAREMRVALGDGTRRRGKRERRLLLRAEEAGVLGMGGR